MQVTSAPLFLMAIAGILYQAIIRYYGNTEENAYWLQLADIGLQTSLVLGIYWFFVRAINLTSKYTLSVSNGKRSNNMAIIVPFIASTSKIIVLLAIINIIVANVGLPSHFEYILTKQDDQSFCN